MSTRPITSTNTYAAVEQYVAGDLELNALAGRLVRVRTDILDELYDELISDDHLDVDVADVLDIIAEELELRDDTNAVADYEPVDGLNLAADLDVYDIALDIILEVDA